MAYNSLMDFDDIPAVSEIPRARARSGVVHLHHPSILDAGGFDGDGDDAPYVLRNRTSAPAIRRHGGETGLTMHFRGWSHSLEQYVSALSGTGLVVDTLREPVPTIHTEDYGRWARYPMFLHLPPASARG